MNIEGNRMYIAYLDNPRLYGSGNTIQHLHYLPFGEDWVDQRNSSWNTPYTFSGKEKDVETGYGYFGARYYDSGLSIWLSVDPMSDKYPSMSPYNYCANNPVILVDPDGMEICGDVFDRKTGQWLGTYGDPNDGKAYVADGKNKYGNYNNLTLLSISTKELLDRATWVFGECSGSNEKITDQKINAGDMKGVIDATVAEYYAHAINNAAKAAGGFYNAAKQKMKRKEKGVTIPTYEGYFDGTGKGGDNRIKFANARKNGMNELMKVPGAAYSIAAVIASVTGGKDPTGGARAWLGQSYARDYYNNPGTYTSMDGKPASLQFSFTSGGGKFFHSFYKIGN